jgi:hypothetical protein
MALNVSQKFSIPFVANKIYAITPMIAAARTPFRIFVTTDIPASFLGYLYNLLMSFALFAKVFLLYTSLEIAIVVLMPMTFAINELPLRVQATLEPAI